MYPSRSFSPFAAPRFLRVVAGLLVLTLIVAAQSLHVPGVHAADGGNAGIAMATSAGDRHDGHAHDHHATGMPDAPVTADGPCAGSICALCLALTTAPDLDLPRGEPVVRAEPITVSRDAPVERTYRPPIALV